MILPNVADAAVPAAPTSAPLAINGPAMVAALIINGMSSARNGRNPPFCTIYFFLLARDFDGFDRNRNCF